MKDAAQVIATRTTTDIVFDQLYEEISTLKLLPGTQMSEAEIAARMGVSRQPVRDAFNRLGNMGLLLIRPQRATRVRGFSLPAIENARFVRLAIELEVASRAAEQWQAKDGDSLRDIIDRQQAAIDAGQIEQFHVLDYDFHKAISDASGQPLAFAEMQRCKQVVDRLCVLSLGKADEMTAILRDHKAITEALVQRDVSAVRAAVKAHLSRLDVTIAEIHKTHSDFFE